MFIFKGFFLLDFIYFDLSDSNTMLEPMGFLTDLIRKLDQVDLLLTQI